MAGVRRFENGRPEAEGDNATKTRKRKADQCSALLDVVNGAGGSCIRIFVAGAETHVGKTTVCLGILSALHGAGFAASELAYIKPATQCEAPDLLAKWCAEVGVEHVSGENAPLVFYKGFTRSFLDGQQGTSALWLQKIKERIDALAKGRRVMIVDGVGFPAVGSIVGVDNGDVAKAARAPVLLVCKSGVGYAIDSFSLNASYFSAKGVPVLGGVFNFGAVDGFYCWTQCAESIRTWFSQGGGRRERFYGVVPLVPDLDGLRERISTSDATQLTAAADVNASHFAEHVDIAMIISDAVMDPWCRNSISAPDLVAPSVARETPVISKEDSVQQSRSEIEASARKMGAKAGG